MKKNNKLYTACISDISDGAFRLLIYAYSKNVPICSLNYKIACEKLNISSRSFYRYKKLLEDRTEFFIEPEDTNPDDCDFTKQFNDFYEQYPRKQARRAAERSFTNAIKRGTHPYVIINAVKKYSELVQEKNTEKQYIPHPATWLNQERWKDEELQKYVESSTNQDLAPETI
tara:strand:- start:74 stop:589 length:516 start_codon:yes stop_codon:yes gene_type:complete